MSLQEQISAFWAQLAAGGFSPSLIKTIWSAERCVQLNAQQIASMPLRFDGSFEPAWLSNPDPVWYPNGISDAVFSAVDSYYRWGDAFIYVTDYYATGFPSGWTVLDASAVVVELDERTGRRKYRVAERPLDATRIVQISRNPRGQLRGTSALASYADMAGATAAGIAFGREAFSNNPQFVLKSGTKLTKQQAEDIQDQWIARAPRRRLGVPPVIDPKLDLVNTNLGFSNRELLLVEAQEFNARVMASAFGVPPFLLNISIAGGLLYQTPALMGEYWWRTELRPSSRRIAEALTANMLPRGSAVVFDAADLTLPLTEQAILDDSATVAASPADQQNVAQLHPVTEVTSQ